MDYAVRNLIYNYNINQIWAIPKNQVFNIIFDNEIVPMKGKQIHISWYYWEMYRKFPGTSILSHGAIIGNYHSTTHRKLGGFLIWHIYYELLSLQQYTVWDLSQVFCEVTNYIYNMTCYRLGEYVTSCSIHDVIELLSDKDLLEAKANYLETVEKHNYDENITSVEISKVNKAAKNLLYNNPEHLSWNGIKKLAQAGLVSVGQILQLIALRGYVHDIDSSPSTLPINVGFAEGLTLLYDSMAESRSASRASLNNLEPLQQSEWFNRKVQIAATFVMDINRSVKSCENYLTVPYLVEEDDYWLLRGKNHMVDGKPIMIWDTIDHLVGTTIELRSITACGNIDVQKVCPTCLGWAHQIIPDGSNLGFELATPICASISQTIMSTKHYESSSSSSQIKLGSVEKAWLQLKSKAPGKLFLSEAASKGTIIIRVHTLDVKNLLQILHIDISELPPSRITKMTTVGFSKVDKNGTLMAPFDELNLKVGKIGVYFSSEILAHLKTHSWDSDTDKNFIEFKLTNWNINKPIFGVPRKGENIMEFFHLIKTFLEPDKETLVKITNFKTRGRALSELIVLLREELNKESGKEFNIIQAEILIRMLMMVNYSNKEFQLPHSTEQFCFVGLKQVNMNRCLTSMLAYQEQFKALLNTNWCTLKQKTKHLMDFILHS